MEKTAEEIINEELVKPVSPKEIKKIEDRIKSDKEKKLADKIEREFQRKEESRLKIQYLPISELKPYKFNPRKNEKAVKIVSESIKEFGFLIPVVIDKNNELIAGHTRIEAAKLLGIPEAPSIKVESLSEDQVRAFRLMDNKSTEYAQWDKILLRHEFESLSGKLDLKLTGFREAEIHKIMDPTAKDSTGDTVGKYQIEPGKVYLLGNHRLICSDSKDPMTFNRLIPPKTDIHMVYTDPPYGVSYKGTNNENGRDWKVIEGDDLRGDGLYDLLTSCFEQVNQYLIKKGALYVFHASSNQIIFEKALNQVGFQVKQQLIWHKHHILGHSHYHWTHEPIFYCSRLNENPTYYGTRDNKTFINQLNPLEMTEEEMRKTLMEIKKNSTVVEFKKDAAKDYIHPTQKPVKMAEHFIINSSRIGENVLEPFAGSGSTLIACENKNRKCFAVEYSQDFCSHIIERWETLTGKKATDELGKPMGLRK